MKSNTLFLLALIFLVSTEIRAQEKDSTQTFEFQFQSEDLLNWSVWRADLYICTGIAFAKENGFSVEDFTKFVAKKHVYTWNTIKGKGIEPIVQGFIWFWKSYQGSNPEIISQSDSLVIIRFDKPYKKFFTEGNLLNVSLSEFEECLFGHIQIMMAEIGMSYKYNIENEFVNVSISENQ